METDDNKDHDYLFKYIIIGSPSVGKSKIVERFIKNTFNEKYGATIGVEFAEKNIKIEDKIIRIQVWDTAGQEKFKSITRGYYKSCICALIVYDITSRESFNDITNWIEDCKNYSPKTVVIVLIGNKYDLQQNRIVSTEEGQELSDKNGISFYETSAREGTNIKEIFQKTGEEIYQNIKKGNYNLDDIECGIVSSFYNKDLSSIILNKGEEKQKKKFC